MNAALEEGREGTGVVEKAGDMQRHFVRPLLSWYGNHARELPWRTDPTPYHVWVSEIMLQQTRIETVRSYYQRFIRALPDIASLASCDDDRLMKLWEGLGYYSRVRNMKKAAQEICREYDGVMPADYERLLRLPGIGPYTAGAIASIAFGIPVAAVDGNVLRVISRVTGNTGDVLSTSVRKDITRQVSGMVPPDQPGHFTQALMELGELICTPGQSAQCGRCPVREHCDAFREGMVAALPVRQTKKEKKIVHLTVLVITDTERVLIRKRPEEGLLAGLYELPNIEGIVQTDEVIRKLSVWGLSPDYIQDVRVLPAARHIFTHLRWEMTGYQILARIPEQEYEGGLMAVPVGSLEEKYAIPTAFSAYTKYAKDEEKNS